MANFFFWVIRRSTYSCAFTDNMLESVKSVTTVKNIMVKNKDPCRVSLDKIDSSSLFRNTLNFSRLTSWS